MTLPGYTKPPTSSPEILTNYSENPWARLETGRRTWYDPYLYMMYRTKSIYSGYVRHQIDFTSIRSNTAVMTEAYDPHINYNPIDRRQLSVAATGIDTRQRQFTFYRYGDAVKYSRADANAWAFNNLKDLSAIAAIAQSQLGMQIVGTMDMLARNTMFQSPYFFLANGEGGSGNPNMSSISVNDKLTTNMIEDIYMSFMFQQAPYLSGASTWWGNESGFTPGTMVCLTTPGIIRDIKEQHPRDWFAIHAYANPSQLLTNEVGTFMNTRFVVSPHNVLWNHGKLQAQVAVSEPIQEGDGAPDELVDRTWMVGQPNAKHYIQLAATDEAGATVDAAYMNANFKIDDKITLHFSRTADFGQTSPNGPDYRDGRIVNARIVKIDANNRRLSFDRPIMLPFTTEAATGKYAYVSKGVHIHVSLFFAGSDAVVLGVAQPPTVYYPPQLDMFQMQHIVAWDALLAYDTYNPHVMMPVFSAGRVAMQGSVLQE